MGKPHLPVPNLTARLTLIAMILSLAAFVSRDIRADTASAISGGGDASIVSVWNGKCLDVEGASQDNFARIITYSCHYNYNQRFAVDDHDDVDFLRSWHTNETKCIDVYGAYIADGTGIIQFQCGYSDPAEGFFVVPFGSNTSVIININSGKCLDVPASGPQVIQYTCHANSNQRWVFQWY